MKKNFKSIIIVLTIVLCVIGYLIYHFFYSMSNLPQGTFLKQSMSPSGEYTITAYLVNGGATTTLCVRGELQNNKTGNKRNIYWDYRIDKAEIVWVNDKIVSINGHDINVINSVYDWRRK
ncbi:DUF5412 domain-containing protein [Brevibacterium sp. JNUCC-42]|nr:DUF5412 domain-containing protein [Brevibacterium sp. JNUCC-42]